MLLLAVLFLCLFWIERVSVVIVTATRVHYSLVLAACSIVPGNITYVDFITMQNE